MKRNGILSFGEAFIDYVAIDSSNTTFERFLGGATVNVAVGVSRLAIPSYYLTVFGEHVDSEFVETQLQIEGVDTSYCSYKSEKSICSVYIHVTQEKERTFHQYVNETPDIWLTEQEMSPIPFTVSKIFYFGSGTLFHPIARSTTNSALQLARDNDLLIAFDGNIRLKRWNHESQCKITISSYLNQVDIVKLAEEELLFLTDTSSLEEGIEALECYHIPYLFITLGSHGAFAKHGDISLTVPGVPVHVIDTTGAGDAFMAALLSCFHQSGYPSNYEQLRTYTEFANEAGATCASKLGAL